MVLEDSPPTVEEVSRSLLSLVFTEATEIDVVLVISVELKWIDTAESEPTCGIDVPLPEEDTDGPVSVPTSTPTTAEPDLKDLDPSITDGDTDTSGPTDGDTDGSGDTDGDTDTSGDSTGERPAAAEVTPENGANVTETEEATESSEPEEESDTDKDTEEESDTETEEESDTDKDTEEDTDKDTEPESDIDKDT